MIFTTRTNALVQSTMQLLPDANPSTLRTLKKQTLMFTTFGLVIIDIARCSNTKFDPTYQDTFARTIIYLSVKNCFTARIIIIVFHIQICQIIILINTYYTEKIFIKLCSEYLYNRNYMPMSQCFK